MARASRRAAVAYAGRALQQKRLRVNDNDGSGDGDGSHADEGGSDDMMNMIMMVVMRVTAMRVMTTITTRNDGAGDSDDLFGLNWWMPTNLRPRQALTLSPDDDQNARGSARSHIRIARRHSTLSTPGLCKHPPARNFAPRAYT